MKTKTFLLVCVLTAVTAFAGCGKETADAPYVIEKEPINEDSETEQQTASEDTASVDTDTVDAGDERAVEEGGSGDAATAALIAYQDILNASLALEGYPEELEDASFGYEQNIEQFGEHYDMFTIADVNQDGVSELFVLTRVNFRWNPISVYTYADGQAVLLKNPMEPEAHGTFEQSSVANGACFVYICEDHHIHSIWRGTDPMGESVEEDYAFALDGTTLTAVDCTVGESENTIYFYDVARDNTADNVADIMQ